MTRQLALGLERLVQQFGAAAVEADDKTFDLERELERVAHGRIVVDDDDDAVDDRFVAQYPSIAPDASASRDAVPSYHQDGEDQLPH